MTDPGHDARGRDGRNWTVLTPARRYATRLYVTAALGGLLGLLAVLALLTLRAATPHAPPQ